MCRICHKHGQYVLPSSRKRCDFSDHSSSRICSKVQIADKFAGEVKFIGSCMKPAGYLMFCHFFSKNEPDSCKSNLSSNRTAVGTRTPFTSARFLQSLLVRASGNIDTDRLRLAGSTNFADGEWVGIQCDEVSS